MTVAVKQVQDTAQAEIDVLASERANNMQTIAAQRRDIDQLQQLIV